MPEGDTIFRTAVVLRTVLEGKTIQRARHRRDAPDVTSFVGHTVVDIEPRGKHLLIHFDDTRSLHSHMGMIGSWHIYRPGQKWLKPERRAAVVLETDEALCVCFNPPICEILSRDALRWHPMIAKLGPDVLAPDLDEREILRRVRIHGQLPIGEAVMNQTLACGIGNIYKSEVLFLTRMNPFVRVDCLDDDTLLKIFRRARELMVPNLGGSNRQTRYAGDGHKLWMYGRVGQPCFECGTSIEVRRQGALGRTTFWCPACQPAASVAETTPSPVQSLAQQKPDGWHSPHRAQQGNAAVT